MFHKQGPTAVVGTWTNPVGTVWTIKPNGTFEADITTDGKRDLWGTYTVNGDQMTMQRKGGLNAKGCQGPGIYKFTRDGDSLTFTLVSDRCKLRKKNILLLWKAKS